MADPGPAQPPHPGTDEIILSAPAADEVCSSLEHRRAGRPAQVIVTLGQMGTPDLGGHAGREDRGLSSCLFCQPQ